MSASSTTYPPPPIHPDSTLYSSSSHLKKDKLLRQRNHSTYTDPFQIVIFILLIGFFLAWKPEFIPFSSSFGITSTSHRSYNNKNQCNCKTQSKQSNMVWQKTFTLPSASRGCHLITTQVEKEISEGLKGCKAGILTLFIQHTSASLTINENYDPDVRKDMDMAMDKVISESLPWKHVDEGPDDSASHTKASLFGPTVTIPITDGRMNLGTWQGVMLCEWRAAKHSRRIVATILP